MGDCARQSKTKAKRSPKVGANKAAWEEAFAKHRAGYKEDPVVRLRRGDRAFLEADVIVELEKIGLEGKEIAQICCNNGRELLTLLTMGGGEGYWL